MDKKKTGNLIREARTKKNYTQSELGDLLGVSNKAVSRWENGESFPDVGVLENLATLLELRIEDIVSGNVSADREAAVVDIVRVATIQQKEKKRRLMKNVLLVIAVLMAMISGMSALKNKTDFYEGISTYAYIIMMVLSFALIFAVNLSQSLSAGEGRDKLSKISKIVAVCSVLWIMMITWALVIMAVNGYVPFGMELTSVALFVNSQLKIIFVCNLVLIIIFAYRFIKYGETVHWGCFVSMAAIYIAVLYSALLGNRSTVQGMIKSLGTRTIAPVLVMGIFITISVIAEKKRQLR